MGKLQDNIQALIDSEYGRGIDGAKISTRLIEAGLEMMADEGDIDETSRIVPAFDKYGDFDSFSVSSFRAHKPEPGARDYLAPLREAFGEMPIKDGGQFMVEVTDGSYSVSWRSDRFDMDAAAERDNVLRAAAGQFDVYARNHLEKGPGHEEKAQRNIDMAAQCYAALGEEYEEPWRSPAEIPTLFPGTTLEFQGHVSELPVEVQEVTGNIAERELAARYVEGKAAGATAKALHAKSGQEREGLEWIARVLGEAAHEFREGMHLPALMIEGKVIPYNEDRDTGLRHADNLRAFFQDVHARNVRAGWWSDITTGEPKKRSVGELLMLFVTEIAEAYDAYTAEDADDKLPHYPGFGVEMVDLGIRWADLCGAAMAGRLVDYSAVRNPGDDMFRQVARIARDYEAIRKTPEAVGDPEEGVEMPVMDIAIMTDAKLDFNAKREDHKIENRLKHDGKRT
jgi:hypothetical protein